MPNDVVSVTEVWRRLRNRLNLDEKAPVMLTEEGFHALLSVLPPEDVGSYAFDLASNDLANAVKYAMGEGSVPASLCEACDQLAIEVDDTQVNEWPALAAAVFSKSGASLESKISAAELVLLHGSDAQRDSILDNLAASLEGEQSIDVPQRTGLALGLVGALAGRYLVEPGSGDCVEYLTPENQDRAIELLNRWRLRGRLWRQVRISSADDERDSLLRRLHELYPDISYSGVQPQDFTSEDLAALEKRVGRSVLLHLATQPSTEAWTQHIGRLDVGEGQVPTLDLVLEARPSDHAAIVAMIDARLAQVGQDAFEQNLMSREDGYASLFELERHNIELEFPDSFFGAAVNVLARGGLFQASKIPECRRQRIISGVWSRMVAGHVNVPTDLLEQHVASCVQARYECGGREEFTQHVLPAMIGSENAGNLGWAVDFLFARHRRRSTIPDASDAKIQHAITEVYPQSSGDIKATIERLTSKGWFTLPERPD